jgi:thiamine-monophosphate kinase
VARGNTRARPAQRRFSHDSAVNEFELIARFFSRPPRSPSVVLGVGDDSALLAPTPGCEIAVSVDMLVAGRHFFFDTDPERLGHKTLAVNLSDLAAMGATPRWALLAGALPENDPDWLAAFARGFFALADVHGVDVVGGDTTRGPLNLCVTILGEVTAGTALTRGGAKPGDDIYVSGTLGDAALAVADVRGRVRLDTATARACRARLDIPTPRIELGAALRGIATAAIDVSDGLTGDLRHILERSNAGADIELARVPRLPVLDRMLAGEERSLALECMLAGGDDYEICFTASVAARPEVAALAKRLALPLARVGSIVRDGGLTVLDESGVPLARVPSAFDHFAPETP